MSTQVLLVKMRYKSAVPNTSCYLRVGESDTHLTLDSSVQSRMHRGNVIHASQVDTAMGLMLPHGL